MIDRYRSLETQISLRRALQESVHLLTQIESIPLEVTPDLTSPADITYPSDTQQRIEGKQSQHPNRLR